jgi:hypothetical protein
MGDGDSLDVAKRKPQFAGIGSAIANLTTYDRNTVPISRRKYNIVTAKAPLL